MAYGAYVRARFRRYAPQNSTLQRTANVATFRQKMWSTSNSDKVRATQKVRKERNRRSDPDVLAYLRYLRYTQAQDFLSCPHFPKENSNHISEFHLTFCCNLLFCGMQHIPGRLDWVGPASSPGQRGR
jgi:hypothetical protein